LRDSLDVFSINKDNKTRTLHFLASLWKYTLKCTISNHFHYNSIKPHFRTFSTIHLSLCRQVCRILNILTAYFHFYIVNRRQSLYFVNIKSSFSIFRETWHFKVKPRLRVDRDTLTSCIIGTFKPILLNDWLTWKSDILLTTLMFPESNCELKTMYLSSVPR